MSTDNQPELPPEINKLRAEEVVGFYHGHTPHGPELRVLMKDGSRVTFGGQLVQLGLNPLPQAGFPEIAAPAAEKDILTDMRIEAAAEHVIKNGGGSRAHVVSVLTDQGYLDGYTVQVRGQVMSRVDEILEESHKQRRRDLIMSLQGVTEAYDKAVDSLQLVGRALRMDTLKHCSLVSSHKTAITGLKTVLMIMRGAVRNLQQKQYRK